MIVKYLFLIRKSLIVLNPVLQTLKLIYHIYKKYLLVSNYCKCTFKEVNNKIKVLKRNAYGYTSFTHFINRILLMSKLFTPTTKKGIKQPDAA